MAKPTVELIAALRRAADKLEKGTGYQWGHMGACNCGHLAQELTGMSKAEIHQFAMRKYGDWTEQVMDFCPTSGLPMDLLISKMVAVGLSTEDLKNLEKLSDKEILQRMPENMRYPKHNVKQDVVTYMKVWIKMLEEKYALSLTDMQSKLFDEMNSFGVESECQEKNDFFLQ